MFGLQSVLGNVKPFANDMTHEKWENLQQIPSLSAVFDTEPPMSWCLKPQFVDSLKPHALMIAPTKSTWKPLWSWARIGFASPGGLGWLGPKNPSKTHPPDIQYGKYTNSIGLQKSKPRLLGMWTAEGLWQTTVVDASEVQHGTARQPILQLIYKSHRFCYHVVFVQQRRSCKQFEYNQYLQQPWHCGMNVYHRNLKST